MRKRILLIILIVVVAVVAAVFIFWKFRTPEADKIIYFYGEGCPHCDVVDEFISENKIEEKVSFEKKEVFNDGENAEELASIAQSVGLAINDIGVPFLWDGSHYYMGDTDIINFIKQVAEIQ